MTWKPISTETIADATPAKASHTLSVMRPLSNVINFRENQSRGGCLSFPLDYRDEYAGGYDGLRIHTHPKFWKVIPIPIPADPYRYQTIRVTIGYRTWSNFYQGRTEDDGMGGFDSGDVELFLLPPGAPPLARALPTDPIQLLTDIFPPAAIQNRYALVNSASRDLVELFVPPTDFPQAYTDGQARVPVAHLLVRSTLGDEVDLGVDAAFTVFRSFRETAVELNLDWTPPTGPQFVPPPPLHGRMLTVPSRIDRSAPPPLGSLFQPMAPYEKFYFVEYENFEIDSTGGLDAAPRRIVSPPFPGPAWKGFRSETLPVAPDPDSYTGAVHETTGISIRSIFVEVE
jgi:hypothetical protein